MGLVHRVDGLARLALRIAARLATSALVTLALVAGSVEIATGERTTTPGVNTPDLFGLAAFKLPVLRNGVLTIEGTRAADRLTLRLKAGDPGVLQIDAGSDGSADFTFKRRNIARIVVNARAGNDRVRISERNGVFTNRIPTTLAGGDGNDVLVGGSGRETLVGGDGSDSIDPNKGNDAVRMGAGDDEFVWNPGDGSDVVEGQTGTDTMRLTGTDSAEQIHVSPNGQRVRFVRDLGNVTIDAAGVEQVAFDARGGADVVTVDDLTGTDVSSVQVDLAGVPGGGGDGEPDRVVVNGTDGIDAIVVTGDAEEVKVSGLAATVALFRPEGVNDRLEINTLVAADSVDVPDLAAGAIQLFVDGVLVPSTS